jgi:DNA polymerase (family 10)
MNRAQVSRALEEIALLLELNGENPFKARAHQNAARAVLSLPESLEEVVATGRLEEVKGIGKSLGKTISTLVRTGSLPYLEELRSRVPPGLVEMVKVPGLGPRRARFLYETLGADSLAALEYACRENRLASLKGFGGKTQAKLLEGIEFLRRHLGRFLLSEATTGARDLLAWVRDHPATIRAALAGAIRRREEIIAGIDLVVSSRDPARLIADFKGCRPQITVLRSTETGGSIRLASGLAADLHVANDETFPLAQVLLTGPCAHTAVLRARGLGSKPGLHFNEDGLYRGEDPDAERLPCSDEEAFYAVLDLPFIPPEIRQDGREIEEAAAGRLPRLVEPRELRGVLHVHTNWSDGRATLEEMIEGAVARGFEYIGISEHSQSAGYAGGLKPDAVERQREAIETLRPRYPSIRILHGIESDILGDGSLDYPEEVLERFDFVVASVHSGFGMPEAEMTRRVIRALENPFTTMLAHPTGRLLLGRKELRIDLDAVIDAAARCGAFIEINANPHRLDLDARRCRTAREAGVLLSINPDAHDVGGLDDMAYGVDTARRGWLAREDILNTRPWEEIEALVSRRRGRA